jgi:dihydroxyacetone kinase-like predicted kinase
MGADLVILSEIAPSSQDFIDAFSLTRAKDILVFPNCANSVLAAEKAGDIYDDARVSVIKTKSAIECHAALSILDFDSDIGECARMANATLGSIDQYSVYHAAKDVKFGDRSIDKNDFFSLSGKELLNVSDSLDSVVLDTLDAILNSRECDVVTLFYGKQISSEHAESLIEKIDRMGYDVETAALPTFETVYDITVTIE